MALGFDPKQTEPVTPLLNIWLLAMTVPVAWVTTAPLLWDSKGHSGCPCSHSVRRTLSLEPIWEHYNHQHVTEVNIPALRMESERKERMKAPHAPPLCPSSGRLWRRQNRGAHSYSALQGSRGFSSAGSEGKFLPWKGRALSLPGHIPGPSSLLGH